MQYNSKDVMPPLILRCKSVVSPFQVRFKSVSSPFLRMGLTWEAQGSYIGLTWELRSFWGKVKIQVLHFKKCLEDSTMSNPVHTSETRMCGD